MISFHRRESLLHYALVRIGTHWVVWNRSAQNWRFCNIKYSQHVCDHKSMRDPLKVCARSMRFPPELQPPHFWQIVDFGQIQKKFASRLSLSRLSPNSHKSGRNKLFEEWGWLARIIPRRAKNKLKLPPSTQC